ncbi:MAG TPA: respiratory nitrate reductase subunit gamma [Candidatus Azoamicus sp. MARI]
MLKFYNLMFSYYPYISIFVFILGSLYRYENNQYTWKSGSSQLLDNKLFFWSSNLFHFGILFLIFGHFFGLLTPKFLYSKIISPDKKQIIAMTSGGFAGILCFIGLTLLIYRRISNARIYLTSNKTDIIILLMLYLQLLLGLLSIFISYKHIDNPSTMIALANWVQGIFLFTPDIHLFIINEHWLFKFHLLLGMTILLFFPFTRLVHVFSFPYLYLLRDGYQITRKL